MPPTWQVELQKMAIQLNRKKVLELLEQIPSEYHQVADYLKNLANQYQFSHIEKALILGKKLS